MLQEDSNGEASFEIIDENNVERIVPPSKNEFDKSLLSNVAPPTALPSFIETPVTQPVISVTKNEPTRLSQQTGVIKPVENFKKETKNYYPTEFSAAIPPNKGIQHSSDPKSSRSSSISAASIAEPSCVEGAVETSEHKDSSGIFGWVKDAVSGGILQKVAEKAKSSVDSMITTLDPQMREYLYSGGDLDVLVASVQEEEVSAIREAFQHIFGKATVEGFFVDVDNAAIQPVGFDSSLKKAEAKIKKIYENEKLQSVPVVAVEAFLAKLEDDRWYELSVVILKDPVRQLSLHTYSQLVPIPPEVVDLAKEDTAPDYPLKDTGFAVTIGSLMAENLGVNYNQWHHTLTGVPRREMILMAGKVVANLYKNCTQV